MSNEYYKAAPKHYAPKHEDGIDYIKAIELRHGKVRAAFFCADNIGKYADRFYAKGVPFEDVKKIGVYQSRLEDLLDRMSEKELATYMNFSQVTEGTIETDVPVLEASGVTEEESSEGCSLNK